MSTAAVTDNLTCSVKLLFDTDRLFDFAASGASSAASICTGLLIVCLISTAKFTVGIRQDAADSDSTFSCYSS